MRLARLLVFSALAARAGADAATPIDSAALARDKAARRIEAALARARAAGVPDAERYTPRPHAEQPRAVDGVGVSRCFFAAGVSKLFSTYCHGARASGASLPPALRTPHASP